MSAFEFYSEEEFRDMPSIIEDGVQLFEQQYGFAPMAFMAPCGVWSNRLDDSLNKSGIKVVQSGFVQYETKVNSKENQFKKRMHYTGQKKPNQMIYTVRNVTFEPSAYPNRSLVPETIQTIAEIFNRKNPAIISSHRVNFIGNLDEKNRSRSLQELKHLLQEIVKRWPDVTFMTSDQFYQQFYATKNAK
jgi:hypothetical protein